MRLLDPRLTKQDNALQIQRFRKGQSQHINDLTSVSPTFYHILLFFLYFLCICGLHERQTQESSGACFVREDRVAVQQQVIVNALLLAASLMPGQLLLFLIASQHWLKRQWPFLEVWLILSLCLFSYLLVAGEEHKTRQE